MGDAPDEVAETRLMIGSDILFDRPFPYVLDPPGANA
jgi:hypothetical protein